MSQFRFGFFSAKGTFLCQPRVERRESANVAEPWETRLDRTESPKGAALTAMAKQRHNVLPTMQGPAKYRIRVRGHLDASWSDRLGGMEVTEAQGPDGDVETILAGRLADQAALSGVLNTLHELHLPLLSAQYLDEGA